jgi:eukaryotic-like serine/threonine-protein kinase
LSIAPGTRFGPYEIAALLGAGGMGEVYRARDHRLERFGALKILAPHLATHRACDPRDARLARRALNGASAENRHSY